jgi:hypothetical protein
MYVEWHCISVNCIYEPVVTVADPLSTPVIRSCSGTDTEKGEIVEGLKFITSERLHKIW